MANGIYESLTELVGNTPLVKLNGYKKKLGLKADIIAKLEYFNPIGSTKDRIVKKIIEDAEKKGLISPEKTTLVEVTSGNTGIAVAAFGAAKGYKVRIYIQDFVSEERKKMIRAFGATLYNLGEIPEVQKVLSETDNDFVAATNKLKESLRQEEGIYFIDQLINEGNPQSHYETTAKEIWEDTKGNFDIVISAIGTAGTLRGISDFVKEKKPSVKIIAVQPEADDTILTGIHNITEVPRERVPKNITSKENVFDKIFTSHPEEAFEAARTVAKTDAVFVGISSGAALWAATELAKKEENAGKKIIVVFADTGLRYLSQGLFE